MSTGSPRSSERWSRVSKLTADALEQPEHERASWLARHCADEELRREVQSLLSASDQASGFLDVAAVAVAGAAGIVSELVQATAGLAPDRRIGAYRILRELGHGGMGEVYLATRADEAFDKQVAVKVVRGLFGSKALDRRFRDERRILASLEHQNVARLLDGGTTDDGLSYLVMEYVDGVPIDVFCRERQSSVTARLQLFQRVCAAVQYAHQRLVIHRDIKPGNILVTADGTPKLLDFGIAKLVDPSDDTTEHTRTALRAFTLENASPEQIRGEPMAVTSDVYGLGVLLYQIVTGARPYGDQASDALLVRAICEDEPIRPSVAAKAGSGLAIHDELEWVILKALRKEPDRRYQSAQLLAEDVRCLLAGLPVAAAPDARVYRARKFIGRHRLAIAAGLLVMLSLVGGMLATLWQAGRAEAQRALAEQRLQSTRRLANAMIFEVNDALEAGSTSARALLLARAAEQLDALAVDAQGNPGLAEELATAYHRLGEVEGRGGTANVGDRASSLIHHRKGLAIRQSLVERDPDDLDARAQLVRSLMSTTEAEDEVEPSFRHANSAVRLAESLAQARPTELRFERLLAAAYYNRGTQYRAIHDNGPAFEDFSRARPLYQEVYALAPNGEVRRSLALTEKRLGALNVDKGQFDGALVHLRRAVELDTEGVNETPRSAARRRDLSTSNTQLGFALVQAGNIEGGAVAYERAAAIREALLAEDPTNRQAESDLASAMLYVASVEQLRGDHRRAVVVLERALELKSSPTFRGDDLPARVADSLADAYEGAGRPLDALKMRRQSIGQFKAYLAAQRENKKLRASFVRGVVAFSEMAARFARSHPRLDPALVSEACAEVAEAAQLDLAADEAGLLQLSARLRSARSRCLPGATAERRE